MQINSAGNVGIGTDQPNEQLHLWRHRPTIKLEEDSGTFTTMYVKNNGTFDISVDRAGTKGGSEIRFWIDAALHPDCPKMVINESGNVGIGIADPNEETHTQYRNLVIGDDTDATSGLSFKAAPTGVSAIFFSDGSSPFDRGQLLYNHDNDTMHLSAGGTDTVYLKDGKVGIGTDDPGRKLQVEHSIDGEAGIRVNNPNGGDSARTLIEFYEGLQQTFLIDSGPDIPTLINNRVARDMQLGYGDTPNLPVTIKVNGKVGIGTDDPGEKLTVRGNILVENANGTPVAEIGEGLDYAEGFDVSQDEEIEAGTVLVIDSANPGKLKVSSEAYDSKVAGIAAGAKGLGSGVRLGVGQFDCDVALAGRVYCNAETMEHGIEAGDLLTTSDIAGYAMKAVDEETPRGAILGKAMQSLAKGRKAQILVLVTLQ